MNNDHSITALALSWLGLIASWLTLSHLIAMATLIFTTLQIVIAVRKLRRDARLEKLQAKLMQPESTL